MDASLLKPSLSGKAPRPIYSRTALFLTAFLIGAFPVVLLAGANAVRLTRIKRDLVWLVPGFIACVLLFTYVVPLGADVRADARLYNRGLGFVLFVIANFMHGEAYRAMETFGTKAPSPWLPVLLATVVSVGLMLACLALRTLVTGETL